MKEYVFKTSELIPNFIRHGSLEQFTVNDVVKVIKGRIFILSFERK